VKQVVEVVGDPAGEPPDGLDLLGLPELVFEPLPLGSVSVIAPTMPDRSALVVADDQPAVEQHRVVALLPAEPVLACEDLGSRDRRVEFCLDSIGIVRVDELGPGLDGTGPSPQR